MRITEPRERRHPYGGSDRDGVDLVFEMTDSFRNPLAGENEWRQGYEQGGAVDTHPTPRKNERLSRWEKRASMS